VLFASGNREATFAPRSNLAIYGLFNGTEGALAERDIGGPGSATILDGHFITRHVVTLNGVTGVLFDWVNIGSGYSIGLAGDVDGAGVKAVGSAATFQNLRISGNHAAGSGGAFAVTGASNITITDGDSTNNTASNGAFLYHTGGSVAFYRFVIGGSSGSASTAGVIDTRAALYLNNCLLANNSSPSFLIDASAADQLVMRNCTVANNLATVNTNVGIAGADFTGIYNCIIWGNASSVGTPSQSGVLYFGAGATHVISDSLIQQWDGSLAEPLYANFSADPRFTFPVAAGLAGGDNHISASRYGLASRSPARDSGWDGGAATGADINNNPRIVDDPFFPNTGFNNSTIDRGCAEAQTASSVCPGDVGSQGGVEGPDGLLDNNDFVVFIAWFFTPDSRADIGRQGGIGPGEGVYDNNDFIVFIDWFFSACP
jgi:hypothetical protein